ncbi:MAG: TraB/GumN family protein, partial [Candidatus Krumholzibacteria bacterium]|nr:TraB/GumN family protein [Candidatus Krumholzibacteria bacterium]
MMSVKNSFARRTVLVVTVLLLVAFAQSALAGDKLYMWQVKSETATITLVGSIHVGQPDFFPLADPYEEAFNAADVLAVEVDMTDPAVIQQSAMLMMQKGMLPGAETLQTRLEPELYARLVAYAKEKGVPLAMYMKLKPGIVAVVLSMEEYKAQGFDPELGIDKHFLDAAKAADKEVRALETVEDQLDIFLGIDDTLDDILINETLEQMSDVGAIIDEMVGYWKSGDADGMGTFMESQRGEGPEMEALYRKLLDDRNVGMTATITEWLGQDQ